MVLPSQVKMKLIMLQLHATQTEMSAFTTSEIFTQTEASIFHLAEVATQTESSNTIYSMTDLAIHTDNQTSSCVQASYSVEPLVSCEDNNDENFVHLLKSTKEYSRMPQAK